VTQAATSTATPIAVFTADNHLQPTAWDDHPTLRDDAYIGLQQVIDYALLSSLPVFLLGDMFNNTRPDSNSVMRLVGMLRQLEERGLPVYAIDGNHDKAEPSWIHVSPVVKMATETFSIGGLTIHGLNFTSTTLLPEALANIPPGVDVLLCHQSWGDMMGIGAVNGNFSDIPYGLVMLTGDYHRTGKWTGVAKNGEPVIAYSPGSTAMQNLGEVPDKYFGVLYSDRTVTWHSIETRDYEMQTCETQEEVDHLVAWMQMYPTTCDKRYKEIDKPILRVKYRSDLLGCYDRLIAAAGDKFHLFLEPKVVVANVVIDSVTDGVEGFANLRTAVTQLATVPQLRNDCLRLLEAVDVDAELELMKAQFMDQYNNQTAGATDAMRTADPV